MQANQVPIFGPPNVELKSAALLFAAPDHAYTRELLSAVPGQTSSSKAA